MVAVLLQWWIIPFIILVVALSIGALLLCVYFRKRKRSIDEEQALQYLSYRDERDRYAPHLTAVAADRPPFPGFHVLRHKGAFNPHPPQNL